jgi:hypothetical protein
VALIGCSQQAEIEQREQFASCDDRRPSTLFVARDLPDEVQVAADGDDGFWLFSHGSSVDQSVVQVDHRGSVVAHLKSPLGAQYSVEGMVSTGDGGATLSTKIWLNGVTGLEALGGPPTYPEVVRMDPDWTVRWRTPVGARGAGATSLVALPDGGVLVAGVGNVGELQNAHADEPATSAATEDESGVFWARLSEAGELLWQRSSFVSTPLIEPGARLSGQPLAVGSDGRVRLVVQSADGLVVISSDLDGEAEQQQLLDTHLALSLIAATGLPDGRLAILSNRQSAILTVVDADGSVLFETGYGRLQQVRPWGIAFSPARDEILLSGESHGEDLGGSRTWLLAVNTHGEKTWTFEREPLEVGGTDGVIGEADTRRGPAIAGLAVAPDGTVLGAGFAGEQLSYFWFGAGACP